MPSLIRSGVTAGGSGPSFSGDALTGSVPLPLRWHPLTRIAKGRRRAWLLQYLGVAPAALPLAVARGTVGVLTCANDSDVTVWQPLRLSTRGPPLGPRAAAALPPRHGPPRSGLSLCHGPGAVTDHRDHRNAISRASRAVPGPLALSCLAVGRWPHWPGPVATNPWHERTLGSQALLIGLSETSWSLVVTS